jgi:hypothetical protein
MKKTLVIILASVIVVIIIIGAVIGFLYYKGFFYPKGRFRGRNLQLNQSQIDDVTSFFSSNPGSDQIQSYCQENRENCFYYCRNINENMNYCEQMMNNTRPGNFTRGNYTGNYTRRQGGMTPLPQ